MTDVFTEYLVVHPLREYYAGKYAIFIYCTSDVSQEIH
jgi:hypothetical protein